MTVIELPDDQAAVLRAKAAAQGLTLEGWFKKLAAEEAPAGQRLKPKKSAYGLLAKYGPGPSEEEIDENRREMFRGFAEDVSVIAGVVDTHAALWYLLKNPRLSATARIFIDEAAAAGHDIVLSPISLAEVVYLVEKNRLPSSAYDELRNALADPEYVIEEAPFTAEVVEAMRRAPRADIPDMPDRIVAATAIYFAVPVISRDGRIRGSAIKTVW